MEIQSVNFLVSNSSARELPKADKPEYAFVGRSNVGKSSLINALTNRNELAKVSSTPGKTQLINHFIINHAWYLVDLPGYGYAKVSKGQRHKFEKLLSDYVLLRKNLMTVFVLVDSRLEPQDSDLEFIEFLGVSEIPLAIVFTKTDKLSQSEVAKNFNRFKEKMLETWEELPMIFHTSSKTKKGTHKLLDYIDATNELFMPVEG
jgi:GTP-binding protein